MFYIGLYREYMKKSSCLEPEGLDYKHHLVDLYQSCSNYILWVKNGPALGSRSTLAYIGKM